MSNPGFRPCARSCSIARTRGRWPSSTGSCRACTTDRVTSRPQRANRTRPDRILEALERGFDKYDVDIELRRKLRDVADHVVRVVEQGDGFRALLQNALTVHSTLVAQQQNDEMRSLTETSLAQNEEVKKISAWAAILFAPTLVGTIYGMNFDTMPELHWALGYPMAIGLMLLMEAIFGLAPMTPLSTEVFRERRR